MQKGGFAIVAEIDGKIVGHCVIVPTEDGSIADLSIFVHQEYQDRGIGQELLKRMIEYAKDVGFKGITLITERSNVRAIHVYKKMGFRVVNPEYEYDMYLPLD